MTILQLPSWLRLLAFQWTVNKYICKPIKSLLKMCPHLIVQIKIEMLHIKKPDMRNSQDINWTQKCKRKKRKTWYWKGNVSRSSVCRWPPVDAQKVSQSKFPSNWGALRPYAMAFKRLFIILLFLWAVIKQAHQPTNKIFHQLLLQ